MGEFFCIMSFQRYRLGINFILILSYFSFCYFFSTKWQIAGYFNNYDAFFDADPNTTLSSLIEGNRRNAITHAFLELISIPIKAIQFAITNFGISEDPQIIRTNIALAVAPLFSTLAIILHYKTLKLIIKDTFEIYIFTLFFSLACSNLMFAIIPETFSISGFLISLLIYQFFLSRSKLENDKTSHSSEGRIWFILAVLLAGITITNTFIFAIVYFIHLSRNTKFSYINASKETIKKSALAVITVAIIFLLSRWLLDLPIGSEGRPRWVLIFFPSSINQVLLNITNLFSTSYTALFALFPTNKVAAVHADYYTISFIKTYKDYLWLTGLILGHSLLIYFSRNQFRNKHWRDVYLISTIIILYNFALHTIFGREMFLYSQHWMSALSLIILPALSKRKLITTSLCTIMLIINLEFIINIDQLLIPIEITENN